MLRVPRNDAVARARVKVDSTRGEQVDLSIASIDDEEAALATRCSTKMRMTARASP